MKKAGKTYKDIPKGSTLYNQKINKDAIQTVTKF